MSKTHQLDAIFRSHLEEMEELNTDLQELIERGLKILSEEEDGAIKELKQSMGQEFSKLKDQARRTRNAFKLEARRQLNSEAAEGVIQNTILQQNIHLVYKAAEIIRSIDAFIKARGLNLLENKPGEETNIYGQHSLERTCP